MTMKFAYIARLFFAISVFAIILLPKIAFSSYPKSAEELSREEMGTILGKDITLYKSGSDDSYNLVQSTKSIKKTKAREILWQAAREVLKNMPTHTADYSSGTLITEWYISRFQPNYSFKVEVTLDAKNSLKIRIYERKLEKGQWYNEPENEKLVQKYISMIQQQANEISENSKKK